MGLKLRSPLVVGDAAPLTQNIDDIKRMKDVGVAAVVLPCLSKEELRRERQELQHYLTYGAESYSEALSYVPKIEIFDLASEYLDYIAKIKEMVDIPIIASLCNGMGNGYAEQIEKAGADALVLFNHFYQPDINLESLDVNLKLLLSTPQDMHLALRWIAILYRRISANLAANQGIHQATDVLKMLMVGADVTQLGSVLLHQGIEHIKLVERELNQWLSEHEYDSVRQLQGSLSQLKCAEQDTFEQVQNSSQLFGSW